MKANICIISGVFLNALGRWLPEKYDNWYFKLQAISILLWIISGKFKDSDDTGIIRNWAIGLAICNVIDEFGPMPEICTNTEKVIASIITLITIYKLSKCKKSRNYSRRHHY